MKKPTKLNEFEEISPSKVEAGIKAAKESIWKEKVFQNIVNPSEKRLKYKYCKDKRTIHPDSDSEDYLSLGSHEDVDDYEKEQEAINKKFVKTNVDEFLKFVSTVPIIDMSFRTRKVKGSHGPCVCSFHACFRPLCQTIAPYDVKTAEIYNNSYACIGKKRYIQ